MSVCGDNQCTLASGLSPVHMGNGGKNELWTGRRDFCQSCLTAKNRFGMSSIRYKISCEQVDMTFVKAY